MFHSSLRRAIRTKSAFNYVCVRNNSEGRLLVHSANIYLLKVNSRNTSSNYLSNINLLKVNNKNTRKRYEICSKLTIKTPDFEQVDVTLVI